MGKTTIAWTDYTFNPVEGCEKVSPGCKNCYAEAQNKWLKKGANWGPNTTRLGRSDAYWAKPRQWNEEAKKAGERRRVFCASVADVFEEHPDWIEPRSRLFQLILDTPNLDWLLLTKRPENIERLWPKYFTKPNKVTWHNVWLGTTVENTDNCWRLGHLSAVSAVVHFVSFEPLLEEVPPLLTGIQWAIIGGESGRKARPFDLDWARSLIKRCRENGVAPFVKQLGARPFSTDVRDLVGKARSQVGSVYWHTTADKAGGDIEEWPMDLRIREFPEARR